MAVRLGSLVAGAMLAVGASALAQMPDARTMSGLPRVVGDLPAGAVAVRVVRDVLSQGVGGAVVELEGSGRPDRATTDADGRAEFSGLPVGRLIRVVAVVDGQRLESQRFEVAAQGGIRLLLVAGGEAPQAGGAVEGGVAASPGAIVFGGDSRVVVQLDDGQIDVFYLLDVVNGGAGPVTAEPLVFEAPAEASGVAVLDGSSPQAEVSGRRVTVRGPFAPGLTPVQIAYRLPARSGHVRVRQPLPATLSQLALFVERAPGLTLASIQVGDQREMASEGRRFIVALGPAVRAGEAVDFEVSGVPYRRVWPRNLALALAAGVLAAGAWGAWRRPRVASGMSLGELSARRERIFDLLLETDHRQRAGELDARAAANQRTALVHELEVVYSALDSAGEPAAGVPGAPV